MTPAELLSGMVANGIGIDWGPEGTLRLRDPGHRLTHVRLFHVLWNKELLSSTLTASITGYVWHRCDCCGEVQLLHAVKASDGKPCRMTFDCEGKLHPLGLVVPPRRRARKIKVAPVPIRRVAVGTYKRRSSSKKKNPFEAKAGDLVALVACAAHPGPRWIRSWAVRSWTCPVHPTDDDGNRSEEPCDQPAVLISWGRLAPIGSKSLTTEDGST